MPVAEAKGVEVRPRTSAGRAYVVADPRRLEQVFLNLLGNAVKFTPAGGRVTVQIAASGAVDRRSRHDTGRGIDPAFLPHVFERFRQADETPRRGSAGGLGLGLFIARRLVEAHGGPIRVGKRGRRPWRDIHRVAAGRDRRPGRAHALRTRHLLRRMSSGRGCPHSPVCASCSWTMRPRCAT